MSIYAWSNVSNQSIEPKIKIDPSIQAGEVLIWNSQYQAFVPNDGSGILNPGSGGGSGSGIQDAINIGTGIGLYSHKQSNILQFKSIQVDGNLVLENTPSELFIHGKIKEYNSINDRNLSTPIAGEFCYVQDKGDGEWGLYAFIGSSWKLITTEESSKTSALSTMITINYNDTSSVFITEVEQGAKVTSVIVEVITPWLHGTSAPIMTIGDSIVNDRLMQNNQNDLTIHDNYEVEPTYVYPTDENIYVYFNSFGATQGSATVIVTFV